MDWDHFQCKCGRCKECEPDVALVTLIRIIEGHFGQDVICSSGYRCAARNSEVGGSHRSQHVKGKAIDVVIAGVAPVVIYDYLDKLFPEQLGLGLYNTHTHVDTRQERARWDFTNAST